MSFTTSAIPGHNGIYYCKVFGLGQEMHWVAPNEDQKEMFFRTAQAKLVIKKLEGMFAQRHIAYVAMDYSRSKKAETLFNLQRWLIEIKAQPERVYKFIDYRKSELREICPARSNAFNENMEDLITLANEKLKALI